MRCGGIFDIAGKELIIKDKEKEAGADDFWSDAGRAEKLLQELSLTKKTVADYQSAKVAYEDLEVLFDFFKSEDISEDEVASQYQSVERLIEELELRRMLSDKEDNLGALLKIAPGAGGTESNDWAEMLMRMYIRWGERNSYRVRQMSYQAGDVAGIKSVTLEFSGDSAYGFLKGESGVHRLVRISPFNAQGKRQTSFASVFVSPVIDDTINIEILPSDISWDTFRSGGAGGQGVNKLETGVRLRHLPTGIMVENTESRSQLQNKENAMRILKSHLYELELRKRREQSIEAEKNKKKIEWGSQIRSYVMQPYKMVKDLRTNYQVGDVDKVLDGDLNEFIKKYLMEFN